MATAAASLPEIHANHAESPKGKVLAGLTIGATGVVFGDIGTSPLYAFREALSQAASDGLYREEIVGVVSLMLWALILIVTLKYMIILMRADNDGEGGVLALLALARAKVKRGRMALLALGAIGAALFYGDAIITPALSVLSAVEGLKSLPGIGGAMSQPHIIMITLAILFAVFMVQAHGTKAVARLFGPVCIIWFIAIGAIGLHYVVQDPAILSAFVPIHAVRFMLTHGVLGLFVLGAVFLTVTGAEALTADMGHFGRLPIRIAWLALVFPALALNYLGQGAFARHAFNIAPHANFIDQDWFFAMVPESLRLAMIVLATAATIIASQAVITGAFSLTQQAMQLHLLPRLKIRQTSAGHAGQIYIAAVNWALLFGVVALVLAFRSSSAMAAAYGIAVTGTMVVTSLLAIVVIRRRWRWSRFTTLALMIPFLALDCLFLGANLLRVTEGGWVPLTIAAGLFLLIWTWVTGRKLLAAIENDGAVKLEDFARSLRKRPVAEVPGVAVFLTSRNELTPHALLHNLKHNHVLHAHNYITRVKTRPVPFVSRNNRIAREEIDGQFTRVVLNYGFMESPCVHDDMVAAGIADPMRTSYFIGRSRLAPSKGHGMPLWQDLLFIFLYRNATDPTDYFNIPHNRVIELGAQYAI
ncbi:potassium transporter Kup [Qipengyuania algicida]|uniref:potassium transporter Kup n=1 Tax=Qipengyuania algicida TaxID=1836209 RepID=UPI003B015C95